MVHKHAAPRSAGPLGRTPYLVFTAAPFAVSSFELRFALFPAGPSVLVSRRKACSGAF